jgi:hypothetical protein
MHPAPLCLFYTTTPCPGDFIDSALQRQIRPGEVFMEAEQINDAKTVTKAADSC